MARIWLFPLLFVVVGGALAVPQFAGGSWVTGTSTAVVFLALALVRSPLVFPRHTPAALAALAPEPIVYWRPGCPFCLRLRLAAGFRAGRANWVNIWRDPDGAAAVRAVADGNETVPTVVVGGVAHVNPPPALLRANL